MSEEDYAGGKDATMLVTGYWSKVMFRYTLVSVKMYYPELIWVGPRYKPTSVIQNSLVPAGVADNEQDSWTKLKSQSHQSWPRQEDTYTCDSYVVRLAWFIMAIQPTWYT